MRALPAFLLAVSAAACSPAPDVVMAPTRPAASAPSETPVAKPEKPLPYPDNRPGSAVDTLFGTPVPDPYRWLEDEKSAEVVAWLDAQDALGRGELAKMPERDAIAARLKELVYVDVVAPPQKRKSRLFYTHKHADKEKGIVYLKEGEAGKPRVLLDPNEWSKAENVSLGTWSPSHDGKKLAYALRKNASDEATLHVLDVDTMKRSEVDVIPGAKYAYPSWTPKGDGFYYTWLPTDPAIKPADRPGLAEVRFHALGTDPAKDPVIREKTGDATKFIGAELSKDGRFLFLSIDAGWTSNELLFRDGTKASAPWVPLAPQGKAHYRPMSFAGVLYVLTDEGAPRWRIFRVDPKQPARERWVEVVPEHPTATIDTAQIVGGRFAVSYLERASSRLELVDLDGKKRTTVALPGLGTVSGPVGDPDDDTAYFGFDSFTSPLEVHAFSAKTAKTKLSSKVSVPIDAIKLVTEQVEYASKDGTKITMFLVRAKDAKRDGDNRTLLYGYGGFQVSLTPTFYATWYPWLERGGILAIPNLRGGGEYGEAWHQAGMLLAKQNVFDDFVGAAQYLVAESWTKPERLVIAGASNGGLLVGAAMTQRPDLFAGVICGVPLLDMVRYHLFGSGRTWIAEYGSAEDEAQFRALLAYSPYHHVEPGTKYPSLLMLTADSDDRVDPMHARKFSAALQDASTGGPVLLRVERDAGHAGADQRKAEVEKGADRTAFALRVTAR